MGPTLCPLSDCECGYGLEDNRKDTDAQARVQHNPMAALRDISNGKPDLYLFQAVVNATVDVPQIWRAGASTLYVRYIVDGYERAAPDHHSSLHSSPGGDVHRNLSLTRPDPHWKRPLIGVINVLTGISNAKSVDQDSAILAKLRKSYSAMCAVIWHDLDRLLPPGSQADCLRGTVCRFMAAMASTAGHQRSMYDKTTIALTMHCWLNMSMNRYNRKSAVDFVNQLLGHLPEDTPSDVLDEAIDVVAPDMIALHMKQVLSDPSMIDEAIEDEFYALKPFIVTDHPWSQTFIRERVYHFVAQTLQRQLKAGSPQFTPAVLHAGFLLVYAFTEASIRPRAAFMEDLVTKTPIIEVASDGLVIAEKNGCDDWIQLFEVMISSTRCLNPECDHRATPRFIVSCQTKLERHYIPIRDTLSKIGGSDSKALETWHRFAESVGISESLLLAKWIREVQCCNPHCTDRAATKKQGKLLKCAQCQSVYYHGRTCQRADWKRHKRQCKRAHSAF